VTPPASAAKRVLIAEDEPSILLSVEFLMRAAGHQVETAGDGAQALAAAARFRPHLVILDIMLPQVDGFEVCRRLRADPAPGRARILMLTARGGEADAARGIALGADAYLTKPFATKELAAIAAQLLAAAAD